MVMLAVGKAGATHFGKGLDLLNMQIVDTGQYHLGTHQSNLISDVSRRRTRFCLQMFSARPCGEVVGNKVQRKYVGSYYIMISHPLNTYLPLGWISYNLETGHGKEAGVHLLSSCASMVVVGLPYHGVGLRWASMLWRSPPVIIVENPL